MLSTYIQHKNKKQLCSTIKHISVTYDLKYYMMSKTRQPYKYEKQKNLIKITKLFIAAISPKTKQFTHPNNQSMYL